MTKLLLTLAVIGGLCCPNQASWADEQDDLAEVRTQMQALERRLSQQSAKRDQVGTALRKVETQIGTTTNRLRELDAEHRRLSQEQGRLDAAGAASEQRLAEQQAALAEQLRMNYMVGRQENLKLLLNQDSPARLGRMMVYYEYLNRERSDRIDGVNNELANLATLELRNREVLEEIATLRGQQQQALAGLQQARDERAGVVKALNQQITAGGGKLQRLKSQAAELEGLVEELNALLAEFPAETSQSFQAVRGQLAWPVPGRLLNDFGQPRAGSLRWNGILVGAKSGASVRALYYGRVVFADWLAGMGLLMVIDHGQGYMSLYGHNEALLKEAGDWVDPGERVALVGDSGGQGTPGLYFEIRRAGEPLNPHRWIKKRLATRLP
jgi:septal ring factor EnvC (AmiA/AmiB activator)